MTKEEHIARHKELHRAIDELLADYLVHSGNTPSTVNLLEMLAWSYQQTIEPDHPPKIEVWNNESS